MLRGSSPSGEPVIILECPVEAMLEGLNFVIPYKLTDLNFACDFYTKKFELLYIIIIVFLQQYAIITV